jgi:hypothetical protein
MIIYSLAALTIGFILFTFGKYSLIVGLFFTGLKLAGIAAVIFVIVFLAIKFRSLFRKKCAKRSMLRLPTATIICSAGLPVLPQNFPYIARTHLMVPSNPSPNFCSRAVRSSTTAARHPRDSAKSGAN